MENQRLHVHSLFFPDTQQAQLVQEQHRFRLLLQKMTGRLFDFFPPCAPLFCAFLRTEADAVLQAGPPENANGWIVRPLHTGRAFSFAEEHAQAKAQREQFAALADLLAASCGKGNSPQRIPPAGIPLPPAQPAFILGFAGENADKLLAQGVQEKTAGICAEVWNCAEVSLQWRIKPGAACTFSWKTGKPEWKKRGAPFFWEIRPEYAEKTGDRHTADAALS